VRVDDCVLTVQHTTLLLLLLLLAALNAHTDNACSHHRSLCLSVRSHVTNVVVVVAAAAADDDDDYDDVCVCVLVA